MNKISYIAMNSNPNEPARMGEDTIDDAIARLEDDKKKSSHFTEIKLSLPPIDNPHSQTDLRNRTADHNELPGFATTLEMSRSIEVNFKPIYTNVRLDSVK